MKKGTVHPAVQVMLLVMAVLLLSGSAKQEKQPITSLDLLAQPGVRIAVGLDVPAVTRIFLSLHARGVPVRTDVYTTEQATAEYLRLLGKGARV